MPSIDLQHLAERENAQVEWKEQVADWKDVVETCVAFANDHLNLGGGYVVCGAAERIDAFGFQSVELVGLSSARLKEILGSVLSACATHVSPPITPHVTELPAADPDKRVLVFTVPAPKQAHAYRRQPDTSGDYYIRVHGRTLLARNGLLRELLVRKQALAPWDERPVPEASVQDIDPLAVRSVLQQIGMRSSTRSVEHFLVEPLSPLAPTLGAREALTSEPRPTYAALLMFGQLPQRFIPSGVIVFSVYPGRCARPS